MKRERERYSKSLTPPSPPLQPPWFLIVPPSYSGQEQRSRTKESLTVAIFTRAVRQRFPNCCLSFTLKGVWEHFWASFCINSVEILLRYLIFYKKLWSVHHAAESRKSASMVCNVQLCITPRIDNIARSEKAGSRHVFNQIESNWPLPYITVPVPLLRDARPAGWVNCFSTSEYARVQWREPKTGYQDALNHRSQWSCSHPGDWRFASPWLRLGITLHSSPILLDPNVLSG